MSGFHSFCQEVCCLPYVSLCNVCFSLTAFKIFSLILVFSTLVMMYKHKFFLFFFKRLTLMRLCWSSGICGFIAYVKSVKIFDHYFLKHFLSLPLSVFVQPVPIEHWLCIGPGLAWCPQRSGMKAGQAARERSLASCRRCLFYGLPLSALWPRPAFFYFILFYFLLVGG